MVIESVIPVTAEGQQTMQVVLRNIGTQTANMSGWLLTTAAGTDGAPAPSADNKPHIFGGPNCTDPGNFTLAPTQALVLRPASVRQCGFVFTMAPRWALGAGRWAEHVRCALCTQSLVH